MKNTRPLWQHLSARILPLSFALFVIVSVLQFYVAGQLEQRVSESRLEVAGQNYADSVNQYLIALTHQIESMAENSIVVNALIDLTGRQDYLPLYLETVGIFGRTDIAVKLVDFQNEFVDSNFLGDSLDFPEASLWESKVLVEGERWIQWREEGIYVAQPVLNRGFPEGAILSLVNFNVLSDGFGNASTGYGQLVLTSDQKILFSSDSEFVLGSVFATPESNLFFGSEVTLPDFQLSVRVFKEKVALSLINNAFFPLVLISLVLILFSIFMVMTLSIRSVKDVVSNLSSAIEKIISSEELNERVETKDSPQELSQLGEQFNHMIEKLQSTTTKRDEVNAIISSVGESVLVCDEHYRVTLSNQPIDVGAPVGEFIDADKEHEIFNDRALFAQFEQKISDDITLWRKSPFTVNEKKQGWVFIGSDISEIRSAQAQMHLLELAIDSSSNGIVVVDATSRDEPIVFANKSFLDITGFELQEILGRKCNFLQGKDTDPETRKILTQSIQRQEAIDVEILNYRKSGEPFWNQLSIDPVFNDDGGVTHFLGVLRDITSEVQSLEELRVAKESAEAAAIAKSDFLATMSHEIRTPMNGVLGMLGLLMNTGLNDEQAHRAKIAQSSARSLLVLINDILDFSKIEAGKLELESIPFDIREMLGEFAEAMAHQAQGKGLELILDVTGIDVTEVKGDPGRLRQVLTNLVGNSIKFTSSGEILVQVSLVREGKAWQLVGRVIDSGIGISRDKIDTLFDAFSQVDASTTRQFGGTGLGLAIVRRLCELMGGQIRVMSEEGRGSIFEFEILLEESTTAKAVVPPVDIRDKHILVIDQNRSNLDVLRGQLKHWGAKVTETDDIHAALALLASGDSEVNISAYDLAIVDLNTAMKHQVNFSRDIWSIANSNGLKLVGLTSMSFLSTEHNNSDFASHALFPKPVTTDDLFRALNVLNEDRTVSQGLLNESDVEVSEHPVTSKLIAPEMTRLLIVDDNQINQFVALGLLEEFGLGAETAGDGEEAISLLQAAPTDAPYTLILMDCQMPVMDGFKATRKIRKGDAGDRYRQLPIIAMTANAMAGDKERCIDAGMNDYMAKPIELLNLKEKLQKWLGLTEVREPADSEGSPVDSNEDHNQIENAEMPSAVDTSVWDKADMLTRLANNEKMVDALVKMYVTQSPERMSELNTALEASDVEQLQKIAHTIKGVASNISAGTLTKYAAELESSLKNGVDVDLTSAVSAIVQANAKLMETFQSTTPGESTSKKTVGTEIKVSHEALATLLLSLKNSISHHEFIDLDELELLKRSAEGRPQKEALLTLSHLLEQFEHERAAKQLESIALALKIELIEQAVN